MKFLYCRKGENVVDTTPLNVFFPSLKNGFFVQGEQFNLKVLLVRILFWATTFGKTRIFYILDENNELMHTSCVVAHCFKFPFMNKGDYEIGPCYTYPKFRGQGLYPMVLKNICSVLNNDKSVFYMIVDESNIASIKGIEKAGFEKCGFIRVGKFLKRFYKTDITDN